MAQQANVEEAQVLTSISIWGAATGEDGMKLLAELSERIESPIVM